MAKESEAASLFSMAAAVVAGIVSWVHWHSIGWCILHVILGWVYVVYYVIRYGFH